MCKRNCAYGGGVNVRWHQGERSCNYSIAMEQKDQKYMTRTKMLRLRVEKEHPDWTRQKKQLWVMEHLQGENCPFYKPRPGAKPEPEQKPAPEPEQKPKPEQKPEQKPEPAAPKKANTVKGKIRDAEAWKLYRQGMNDAAMAKVLNVTSQSIWQWRQRHGLPPQGEYGPGIRKYDRGEIKRRLEEGQSVKQIAEAMGCKRDSIYKIARAEGLDLPKKVK